MEDNSNSSRGRHILRCVFVAIFAYILLNLVWSVVDPPVSTLPEEREDGYFDPIVFVRIIGIAVVAMAIGGLEYWRIARKKT